MAFKISKGKTVDHVDIRLSDSQTENEIIKLRKENAYLKKSLDELSRQKGEPSDSENNKLLLERILALETLREKNSQQILSRDQEIASLRQQLRSNTAEVVASLQAQLNQQKLDAEMRENLFHSLKQETEELKTKLVVISAKCQDLENTAEPAMGGTADGLAADRDVAVLQEHLNDALEKNQQWLAYDQQREAYVRTVVERTQQLERQLEQANKAFQQKDREARSEESLQRHVNLLHTTRAELEEEQEKAEERRHCEEEQREARRQAEEERRRVAEHFKHLRTALDDARAKLGEEKLRSSVLLEQVNHFQKILLAQQDDQNRMLVLEQQIQASAKDLEDEKRDNHHLQRHLHKVLKELRKAKDKVARSECERSRTEMPSSSKASKEGPMSPTSPTKAQGLLDESFLECPNCRAQYPTSHHRELLIRQRLKRMLHIATSQSHPQVCTVSNQDYKLFRTLLVLVVSFLIMWTPIFVPTFLIHIRNHADLPITSSVFFWVLTFTVVNSTLNPVLYSLYQLRNSWEKLCCTREDTLSQRQKEMNGD